MPAYARRVGIVLWKDLLVERRSKESLNALLFFGLLLLFLFQFSLGPDRARLESALPGLLWLGFVLAGLLGLGRSFLAERENDCGEGLLLTAGDKSAIYLGKLAANICVMGVVEIVILLLFGLFFDVDLGRALPGLAVILPLGTVGLAAVGTLFAARHRPGARAGAALPRPAPARPGAGAPRHRERDAGRPRRPAPRRRRRLAPAPRRRRHRLPRDRAPHLRVRAGGMMPRSAATRALGWLALLGLLAGLGLAFGYAPREAVQGNVQRIMYVHVPAVLTAYLAFALVLVGSIGYLASARAGWDRLAAGAAELGVLFTGITIASGSIWGKPTWGTWWTWDARLTSTAILFLVYVGYLLLRAMVDEPERRGRFAAVVGIVGAANIPIVHFSVKWWRALHQPSTILGPEPSPIAAPIAAALAANWAAFTLLFVYLLVRRIEIARLEEAAFLGGVRAR